MVSNFEKDKNYKIDLKLDPSIVSLLQLEQEDYDLSDLLTNDTSKLHISEEIGHVSMDLKPLESRIFLFTHLSVPLVHHQTKEHKQSLNTCILIENFKILKKYLVGNSL